MMKMYMEVDWEKVEQAGADNPLDCLPSNARGWTKFKEQYEDAVQFVLGNSDPSNEGLSWEDINALEEVYLFKGCYKCSPYEFVKDSDDHPVRELLDLRPIAAALYFFEFMKGGNLYDSPWHGNSIHNVRFMFGDYLKIPRYTRGPVRWNGLFKCPEVVGGDFTVQFNKDSNIYDLEGCPKRVLGEFVASDQNLRSLIGGPEYVDGSFDVSHNQLQTLIGAPAYIGRNFNCSHNNLSTFEGCPKKIGVNFYAEKNSIYRKVQGVPLEELEPLKGFPDEFRMAFIDSSVYGIFFSYESRKAWDKSCSPSIQIAGVITENREYETVRIDRRKIVSELMSAKLVAGVGESVV